MSFTNVAPERMGRHRLRRNLAQSQTGEITPATLDRTLACNYD